MTIKKIYQNSKLYLLRFSWPIKSGTIKLHIIFQDDLEEPHTHPWNFKSLLLIPYKELLILDIHIYPESLIYDTEELRHVPFKVVKRTMNQQHRVALYTIFGIKIPSITIGKYGHKVQLCSFCKDLGYCKSERK